MHALYSAGVHHEKLIFPQNTKDSSMDYRQKMIVSSNKKYKNEEDDDDDLEALRLAALKSVRAKPVPPAKPQPTLPQQNVMHTGRPHFPSYNQRFGRREYYHPNRPPRQNGNVYHPSRVNQNLIEIIPVEESTVSPTSENKPTPDPLSTADATEDSKFQRYTDDISGSDEEDLKIPAPPEEKKDLQDDETGTDKENLSEKENSPSNNEDPDLEDPEEDPEEEDEKEPEDDDDILLMADIEEENSLERLMDEMEREMNVDKSPVEKKDKKPSKKDSKRPHDSSKSRTTKNRSEKLENSSIGSTKTERRSVSPYSSKQIPRNRSLSPKQKPRKKSPRRSPPRQLKKSQREPLRLQPARKSPPRYSPRPRSPRASPRRSPIRSPPRRPSPRGRSHSRSPRRRSRSPKILSRPHSPRFINRTRSPLRMSPGRSPLPRSPRQSPHRLSPLRRASPRRSRSPRSPRRSPRSSPRRPSPMRRVSPRISPRRSPWSSPRNSPRLSPRRRRSPPKERKRRSPSIEDSLFHKKENSPIRKSSPEFVSKKTKSSKETIEVSSDPVLEARRRKFESTKPIDPVTANKKIKLSKKESKVDAPEDDVHLQSPKRKTREIIEEYEVIPDEELSLHEDYNFEDLEQVLSDVSDGTLMCVSPVKVEKERVKKKKKKDKEIYQVGKMKDAAIAGRPVKEKKCKKKKEVTPEVVEEAGEIVGEEAADEEVDLRTELSRKRAERLNRTVPIPPARLLQSAFKGVVNEAAKNNAKVIQRHLGKSEDKSSQKEVRRVTVVHRTVPDLSDSEDNMDSKMPVRFRLGMNNPVQESRESKVSRKSSKRLGRKGKKLNAH